VTEGCIYADRCKLADERCLREAPPPYRVAAANGDQMARCHYHERAAGLPRATPEAISETAGSPRTGVALRARNVSKTFRVGNEQVRAVHDVSLDLAEGETLGLVGESGSGKTTLAKLLLGLISPDEGATLELDGAALPPRVTRRNDAQVKSLQIVFQNPDSALNRAHSVRRLIARSLAKLASLRGAAKEARLQSLVESVRLPERYLGSRTRQLSGGLKQRVAIARAFAGDPRVVVCDEPTSALDVSVQAAILNLLADLQRERGVSYVFISHDLNVVRYLSDRIAVLYLGRIMEIGRAADVFGGPQHPYTEALLSSVPTLGDGVQEKRIRLSGELPSAANPPSGCVFNTRCPRKLGAICEEQAPPDADAGDGHRIRCHIPVAELRALQIGSKAAAT
jgi:peptide/nickel transport system ATP-binding protein